MVDAGADIAYAFPIEGSKGTWDLVKRAQKAGIPVQVYGEDFGTIRKAEKPKRKAPAKAKLSARDYFNMGRKDLVARGDARAIKELKRRGRDAQGRKIR